MDLMIFDGLDDFDSFDTTSSSFDKMKISTQ